METPQKHYEFGLTWICSGSVTKGCVVCVCGRGGGGGGSNMKFMTSDMNIRHYKLWKPEDKHDKHWYLLVYIYTNHAILCTNLDGE